MASIILKWLRRCLFICIFAVFFMSHNASAISPVYDLSNYELTQSFYGTANNCVVHNMINTTISGSTYCRGQISNSESTAGIISIQTNSTFNNIKTGTIVNFNLVLTSDTVIRSDVFLRNLTNVTLGYDLLDFKLLDSGKVDYELLSNDGTINQQGLNYDLSIDYYEGFRFYRYYELTLISRNDNPKTIGISMGTEDIFQWNVENSFGSIIRLRLNNVKIYNYVGSEENREQEQATQDAADESADSGDQSAADAENATAGLISVIGGFVNAITSASPTNCKINGKINNSFNMGELDLCSMPVPSFVQIISSLILIAICIPFAIIMFNRFIGLFRSFQG